MAKLVEEVITPAGPATVVTEVVDVVAQSSSLITPKRVVIATGVTLIVVGGILLARKLRKHAEEVESETDKD